MFLPHIILGPATPCLSPPQRLSADLRQCPYRLAQANENLYFVWPFTPDSILERASLNVLTQTLGVLGEK